MGSVDPVTLEVVQSRLSEIAHEAGLALIRTGASPVIVHTKDLGFNVADARGRSVVYSRWMPRHGTTLSYMLDSTRRRFPPEKVHPGDMFLTNNPFDGALHNLDLAVLSPCYFGDEIIAWTGCATHHMDMGGMSPGRAPMATDCIAEGLIFPPMKIVERGELREDFFEFLLTNVRVPEYTGLDLKGQIAANNVAQGQIVRLAQRYGADTLRACYDEMIDISEAKTRERIRKLRPGHYETTDYLQYDRTHTVKCALIVDGDTLTFDFTGTDPQASFFVNSALPCTVANVHNLFICLLIPDLVINEGCFRPLKFVVPPGTIFACQPPAPAGAASVTSGHTAAILALRVLSLALLESEEWWRANASWGIGRADTTIYGQGRNGQRFVARTVDVGAHGGGARANKDGVDAGGVVHSTNQSTTNIEFLERRYPLLFLHNRLRTDSGGAGKYRGGVAAEMLFKLHGVDQASALVWCMNKDVPNLGLAGGGPGGVPGMRLKRDSNVKERLKVRVPDYEEIQGEETVLGSQNPPFVCTDRDVFLDRKPAGGGFGDPLERDPEAVLRDVQEGYVSVEAALQLYGVVLLDGARAVDPEATVREREGMRT
ncbi:MAG: hydantoinase B/oxoprolinase family protein [Chloroflexi bacterium]|nr:hydantoinase B/oxoprolinase family protein [Chloroflexota bacterium]